MKGWEMIVEIQERFRKGESVSSIARRFKIDRKTVRKYVGMSMDDVAAEKTRARTRSKKVDKFGKAIEMWLKNMEDDGVINAQAICDHLRKLGYTGSARTVRRYVAVRVTKRRKHTRVYKPFETEPGDQAMVDLGESRRVMIAGERKIMYFAVMTLSYSRRLYVRWSDRPFDTETFMSFHREAFAHFDGVPGEIVYDQTKLVAIKEKYGEVEFNRDFYGFSQWHDFKTYLCAARDPETKGKVEASVRYVKRGFIPGRRFDDVADLLGQWAEWHREVADVKPNETTGEAPSVRFERERGLLRPLCDSIYTPGPACKIHHVYKDGLVKVLANRYSVPYQYHGGQVKVRVTDDAVEIRGDDLSLIYTHRRLMGRGGRVIVPEHYEKPKTTSTAELEQRARAIYHNERLLEALKKKYPRHYCPQLKQFIKLAEAIDPRFLQLGAEAVLNLGIVEYEALKRTALTYRDFAGYAAFTETDPHPVAAPAETVVCEERNLDYYDRAVRGRR